jgi:hypothetical protein
MKMKKQEIDNISTFSFFMYWQLGIPLFVKPKRNHTNNSISFYLLFLLCFLPLDSFPKMQVVVVDDSRGKK